MGRASGLESLCGFTCPVNEQDTNPELAHRLFKNFYFTISWVAFLAFVMSFVSWPLRNCALVCWAYGSDAYFHHRIRVLYGKPCRFSTGELVPTLPDVVTGFGAFAFTVFGLTLLLIFALRLYERHFDR